MAPKRKPKFSDEDDSSADEFLLAKPQAKKKARADSGEPKPKKAPAKKKPVFPGSDSSGEEDGFFPKSKPKVTKVKTLIVTVAAVEHILMCLRKHPQSRYASNQIRMSLQIGVLDRSQIVLCIILQRYLIYH